LIVVLRISIIFVRTIFVVEQQRDLLWWAVFVDVCRITAFPKNCKCSVEQLLIFWSMHQCCTPGPIHIVTFGHRHNVKRLYKRDYRINGNADARTAQHTRKRNCHFVCR